jgi:hypothetical protein
MLLLAIFCSPTGSNVPGASPGWHPLFYLSMAHGSVLTDVEFKTDILPLRHFLTEGTGGQWIVFQPVLADCQNKPFGIRLQIQLGRQTMVLRLR